MKYLGVLLDRRGVRIDQTRIDDICSVQPPTSVKQLQGFLGMTNFVAAFIESYTDITAPLRDLLKKDTTFIWQPAQQLAFDKLKAALTTAPVLRYFDPQKPNVLSVDASQYGVGAVLMQQSSEGFHPLAYASRTLSDTQRNYAQLEKEMLAIVFGCTKFHYYVFSKSTILT